MRIHIFKLLLGKASGLKKRDFFVEGSGGGEDLRCDFLAKSLSFTPL